MIILYSEKKGGKMYYDRKTDCVIILPSNSVGTDTFFDIVFFLCYFSMNFIVLLVGLHWSVSIWMLFNIPFLLVVLLILFLHNKNWEKRIKRIGNRNGTTISLSKGTLQDLELIYQKMMLDIGVTNYATDRMEVSYLCLAIMAVFYGSISKSEIYQTIICSITFFESWLIFFIYKGKWQRRNLRKRIKNLMLNKPCE